MIFYFLFLFVGGTFKCILPVLSDLLPCIPAKPGFQINTNLGNRSHYSIETAADLKRSSYNRIEYSVVSFTRVIS